MPKSRQGISLKSGRLLFFVFLRVGVCGVGMSALEPEYVPACVVCVWCLGSRSVAEIKAFS